VPSGGKVAALHELDLLREVGVRARVALEQILPLAALNVSACAHAGCEVLVHALGNEEALVGRHAEELLRGFHSLDAEWLAVRLRGVLDRGAVPDMAVNEYQRWAFGLHLEGVERA